MKTVTKAADIVGLTVRMIQEYEKYGVAIKPTERNKYGYLMYDDDAIDRLWQIRFYRELGYDKKAIKAVFDDPCYDFSTTLETQVKQLEQKRQEIDNLINIANLMKETGLTPKALHSQAAMMGATFNDTFGVLGAVTRQFANDETKPGDCPITDEEFEHKLQETRAFVGFSRAEPSEMPISERKKMLRLGSENWLPAIQVHGEGIFFEFNKEAVEEWAQRPAVLARLRNLQDSYRNSKFGANVTGDLRPEFVLIHTFAHLIINQLSFECGYGSSSIRERIYCEKAENEYGMYGVLIYTASGDSEGSLGGLVRQGAKDHIEDTIRDAVRNAAWCSSDPVCIQSYGQGPESCNLAACHNCALLPETCCECGNRLLDRGTVVGTLDNKSIGFFAELLEQ